MAANIRTKYDPEYIKNDAYDRTHGGKYSPDRIGPVPGPPKFEMPRAEDIFKEALKNDKAETLVVIAAGINTKDALNEDEGLFYEFRKELQARYGGKARIIVTYPLGESDSGFKSAGQAAEVGAHMLANTGGKEIADAVAKNKGNAGKVVLIGHSGGGQAVGDALEELDKRGISVHHALQIGAPKDKVKKEYADKVTRIQAPEDFVSNYVTIDNVTGIAGNLSPAVGGALAVGQGLASSKYAYPETIVTPITVVGKWGGHSDYFRRKKDRKTGIKTDNISVWIDKVWDKIK